MRKPHASRRASGTWPLSQPKLSRIPRSRRICFFRASSSSSLNSSLLISSVKAAKSSCLLFALALGLLLLLLLLLPMRFWPRCLR